MSWFGALRMTILICIAIAVGKLGMKRLSKLIMPPNPQQRK
jgi:hypothetical protein